MSELKSLTANALFLSKMCHEMKNPIHGIIGFSGYLHDHWETTDYDKRKSLVENISKASVILLDLMEKIRELVNLGDGTMNCHFEEINVMKFVQSAIENCKLFIFDENPPKLSVECDDQQITIIADPFWVNRLLSNLLDNAMKYSHGTTVRIKIDSKNADFNQDLLFSVIDDGVGVPEEEMNTIFDLFTQSSNVDKSLGGSGLGLALCKEIVTLHGGTIWAQKNQNGLNVSFTLPKKTLIPNHFHSD